MSNLKISIGADPELFLRDKKTGLFVSAHSSGLPGTKLSPYKVDLGAVQVDGVAAEFNIDPTYSAEDFIQKIGHVKGRIKSFVGDLELVEEPVAIFDPGYFRSLPDEVRELGCNPDYNAWTGQVNEKPDGDVTTMRTASGHLHIGWTDDADVTDKTHIDDCMIVARQLDYYLGVFSLLWDPDNRRRSLYGKAGAMRVKPYGLEYRTLSNVWLRSAKLQDWIWRAAYKGVTDLIQNGIQVEDKMKDAARSIIDDNNVGWMNDKSLSGIYPLTGMSLPPQIETERLKAVATDEIKKRAKFVYMNEAKMKTVIKKAATPFDLAIEEQPITVN